MNLYKLFWDEFSSWYLEAIKPAYGQPIDAATYNATLEIFEKMLALLHPFMPFITEELWQHLRNRADGESIMVSQMPKSTGVDEELIKTFERVKEIIAGIRNIRQEKNIAPKNLLSASVRASSKLPKGFEEIIMKLAGLDQLSYTDGKIEGAASFMVGVDEVYVPLQGLVDVDEERQKILAELEYTRGFLDSVLKKLSNERFVNNAPANVVELERKKQSDAETKIKALEERLKELK